MLKNKKSDLSKLLFSTQTKRRVLLTGTPLQNNIMEYYNMLDWANPGCLGTEMEFENKYHSGIMDTLNVSLSFSSVELLYTEGSNRQLFFSFIPD